MSPAQKKNYSVKEAAKLLGVSTNTLYKYLDEGKIRSRRIGRGRFKIPKNELLPFLEVNETTATQPPVKSLESSTPSMVKVRNTQRREEIYTPTENQAPITNPVMEKSETPKNVYVTYGNPAINNNGLNEENLNQEEQILGGNEVKFGFNDKFIFWMFNALVFIGLGLVYIFTSPINYALETLHHSSINAFLMPLLPYALMLVGFVYAVEIILIGKKFLSHVSIDVFASLVAGYYALVSLIYGNYGLFVFTTSICGMTVEHLIVYARNNDYPHTFLNSFAKFSLLLAIMGGIIVTLIPESFPIFTLVGLIRDNREVFAFLWFLLLFVPAAFLISPGGQQSNVKVPYFTFGSILALIIAVKSMLIPNWDIAFICFLTGIFGIFLVWWIESKLIFDINRLRYLFFTFLWIAFVILISFVTLDIYGRQSDKQTTSDLQMSLNNVSTELSNLFENRDAILTSYAGKESIAGAIKSNDTETAISEAKEVYDQVGNVARVLIYNNKGIAVGAYPRSSISQGTNFSSREYFQKTLQSKNGYISSQFTSILDTPTVMQTEPVFENNEVIGIIGIATSPDNFTNALRSSQGNFDINIHDSAGNLVVGTQKEINIQNDNIYSLVDKKTNPIVLTRQIDNPNWEISASTIEETTSNNLSTLAMSLVAIIILNSLFSVFAGVQISKKRGNKEGSTGNIPYGQTPEIVPTN